MICNRALILLSLLLLIQVFAGSSHKVRHHASLNSNSNSEQSNPAFLSKKAHETPRETKKIEEFTILKRIPRQDVFFTEGFGFKDALTLVESSGRYGHSLIQLLKADDMSVIKQQTLDKEFFGEGCDVIVSPAGRYLYQLTWKERKAFLWDPETLELKNTITIPDQVQEGWGMTKRVSADNKEEIFISDGSDKIHVLDPETFSVKRSLSVSTSSGKSISNLNELEFVHGKLWANIWETNDIAVIDPEDGFVEALINLAPLQQEASKESERRNTPWNNDSVLNGIAYHPGTDKILVTGKTWPLVWEIRVDGL